jgi:hypothetical protein
MTSYWSEYFIEEDYDRFWNNRLADEGASVCLILGIGFDPRSLTTIKKLAKCKTTSPINCIAIVLIPPSEFNPSFTKLKTLTQQNLEALHLLPNVNILSQQEISLKDDQGYLTGGRKVATEIYKLLDKISAHRDTIVDISGLPRTVFFPLISYLHEKSRSEEIKNLHIAVTEDSTLDGKIESGEFGQADYLQYFHPTTIPSEAKFVWLPVLSSSEANRFIKIYEHIDKDCAEICPILPFPARNLRKVDDILTQMYPILFNRMLITNNNILLCDERNPFDIYRKILKLNDYYQETLRQLPRLQNLTTVVSPLASKMLSLGMLLAAIERKIAVSYAEAGSYRIDVDTDELVVAESVSPVEIWLTGEPYT